MGKGSKPRPFSVNQEKYSSEYDRIFGKKQENPDLDPETQSVRYKRDPDSGKMIPDYMWAQYDMLPPRKPRSHFIWRDSKHEYTSPIDGRLISGRRAARYDLDKNGCRIYEGRDQEQKEANRHTAHEERKFEKVLDESISETLNDIKYQNNPPPETDKNGNAKMSWTFGE